MSLDAAIKALQDAGYNVGNISNLDSSKDQSQAKVTGQSQQGDSVDLSVEYPAAAPAADPNANNQEQAGTTHTGMVNISVPSGASSQHVQIVVSDDNGSRVSMTGISLAGTVSARASVGQAVRESKYISIIHWFRTSTFNTPQGRGGL